MRRLLDGMKLSLLRALDEAPEGPLPQLVTVNGCVFFADEYKRSASVSPEQFRDRTGYECFVNHFHVPYNGTLAAFRQVTAKIAGIRRSLAEHAPHERFLIVVSIAEGECTIRFHTLRPGEAWLAEDLEGYTQEALAAISVGEREDI